MKRQAIAVMTLGSFIIFSFSCTSIREIRPEALMSRKTRAKDILRIEKTSGESIVFHKGQAGGVVGNSVAGIGAKETVLASLEIENSQVKAVEPQVGRILMVKTRDNTAYLARRIVEKAEAIEIWVLKSARPLVFEPVAVPIGQVEKAYVRKLNILATTLAILAPIGLLALISSLASNFTLNIGTWE